MIPVENGSCFGKSCLGAMEECLKQRWALCQQGQPEAPQSHQRNGPPQAWGISVPAGIWGLKSAQETQLGKAGPCILLVNFAAAFILRGQGREGNIKYFA